MHRFGCLQLGIRARTPAKACRIIIACAVLHNIATMQRDHITTGTKIQLDSSDSDNSDEETQQNKSDYANRSAGKMLRDHITYNTFNY